MRARASAVEELEAAGTFDDITQLGSGEDDLDRQLKALTSESQVDDDLAKLRAEIGSGDAPKPAGELGEGEGKSA
jgi:phage shock protein A